MKRFFQSKRRFPLLLCSLGASWLLIGCVLVGCGGGGGGASVAVPTATPSPADAQGRIVFASNRDATGGNGNFEIYSMRPDGGDIKRLTNHTASDSQPSWSYDRRLVAFASNRDGAGKCGVFVMNADGSNVRRVSQADEYASEPAFGPDGRIVYQAQYRTQPSLGIALVIVSANGSDRRTLIGSTQLNLGVSEPVWSRQNLIAFTAGGSNATYSQSDPNYMSQIYPGTTKVSSGGVPDHTSFICTIKPDGTGFKRLFPDRRKDGQPVFTSNGNRIRFWQTANFNSSYRGEVYECNVDGSNLITLPFTNKGSRNIGRFSHDGLNFVSVIYETSNSLFVFDSSGQNGKNITNSTAQNIAPDWK